jgi:transcriptional regulator with XRE-family HTH domain
MRRIGRTTKVFTVSHDSSSLSNGAHGPAGVVVSVGVNVRRLRQRAGWSLGDLARAAGVSKSTVSTIEGGDGNPGLETLVALSVALGVPFGALMSPSEEPVDVLTQEDAPALESADGAFRGRLMYNAHRTSETEVYTFELEAGSTHDADPHPPGAMETVICNSGRLAVGPTGDEVQLGPGDRVTFDGGQPHRYRAAGRTARFIIVISYR